MASWTLLDHSVAPNRVYTRSMGSAELAFYWDSAFTGTADSVQQAEVQSVVGNLLFDLENLSRTWVELKNRFPLLGSRFRIIDEGTATEIVEFVVEENRLARVDEDDISILCVSSREEAYHVADKLVNGPRQLSDSLPARLYILRRADQGDHFHIFLHVAHPIYDGIANMTLLRNFLDILTSPSNTIVTNLEERLQMVKALEALQPSLTLSVAKQRWKRAIGHVICSMKTATTKVSHCELANNSQVVDALYSGWAHHTKSSHCSHAFYTSSVLHGLGVVTEGDIQTDCLQLPRKPNHIWERSPGTRPSRIDPCFIPPIFAWYHQRS